MKSHHILDQTSVRAALVWWALLASGVADYFLTHYGLWVEGLSVLGAVAIPVVVVIWSSRELGRCLLFTYPENGLYWLFLMCVLLGIGLRLSDLLAIGDSQTTREALMRPGLMVTGYFVGQLIGSNSRIRSAVFGSWANLLVVVSVFIAVVLVAGGKDFSRAGGGDVFAFADGVVYVGIGVLAPMLASLNLTWFLIGVLPLEGLLVLLGLRGDLLAFNLSLLMVVFLRFLYRYKAPATSDKKSLRKSHMLILWLVLACSAAGWFLMSANVGSWFDQVLSRISTVWSSASLSADQSYNERVQLQAYGMSIVNGDSVAFFTGKFGYEFQAFGTGGYIHNFLSVWAEFGFMAFLATIAMASLALIRSVKFRLDKASELQVTWLYLHWLFAFLLFRTYFTVHFWVALGSVFGLASCRDLSKSSSTSRENGV